MWTVYMNSIRLWRHKAVTSGFCPRDSGPMILHIAYRQILTYALKDIKLSTFEYFYMKTAQKQTKLERM